MEGEATRGFHKSNQNRLAKEPQRDLWQTGEVMDKLRFVQVSGYFLRGPSASCLTDFV